MAANLELQLTARYEICLIIIFIGLPGSELSKSTMGSTKKQLYSVVVKRSFCIHYPFCCTGNVAWRFFHTLHSTFGSVGWTCKQFPGDQPPHSGLNDLQVVVNHFSALKNM